MGVVRKHSLRTQALMASMPPIASHPRQKSGRTHRPGRFFINAGQQKGVDGTDADNVTEAMVAGRRDAKQLTDLMRKAVPGFERARLVQTSHVLGVRERTGIDLTEEELKSIRVVQDIVELLRTKLPGA